MSEPINITADDIVGILVHNCNQAAAHLGVHGINTDWAAFMSHITRMQELAVRAHSMVAGPMNGAGDAQYSLPNLQS